MNCVYTVCLYLLCIIKCINHFALSNKVQYSPRPVMMFQLMVHLWCSRCTTERDQYNSTVSCICMWYTSNISFLRPWHSCACGSQMPRQISFFNVLFLHGCLCLCVCIHVWVQYLPYSVEYGSHVANSSAPVRQLHYIVWECVSGSLWLLSTHDEAFPRWTPSLRLSQWLAGASAALS